MWQDAKEHAPSKRDPILVRSAACVSVAVWSDKYKGWVAQADGFNAHNHLGDVIVIDKPDYWAHIPVVRPEWQ